MHLKACYAILRISIASEAAIEVVKIIVSPPPAGNGQESRDAQKLSEAIQSSGPDRSCQTIGWDDELVEVEESVEAQAKEA